MQLFPEFPGIDIKLTRKETFETKIQTSASGKEYRYTFQANPKREYSLTLNFLRQNKAEFSEYISLVYAAVGAKNPFILKDSVDGSYVCVRFSGDSQELERLYSGIYKTSTISLTQLPTLPAPSPILTIDGPGVVLHSNTPSTYTASAFTPGQMGASYRYDWKVEAREIQNTNTVSKVWNAPGVYKVSASVVDTNTVQSAKASRDVLVCQNTGWKALPFYAPWNDLVAPLTCPLNDGRLLIFGGTTGDVHQVKSYIVDAKGITQVGDLHYPKTAVDGTGFGVRLRDGRIFTTGFHPNNAAPCEIFDPNTMTWSQVSDCPLNQSHMASVSMMHDGNVAYYGGWLQPSLAIYNPDTNQWVMHGGCPVSGIESNYPYMLPLEDNSLLILHGLSGRLTRRYSDTSWVDIPGDLGWGWANCSMARIGGKVYCMTHNMNFGVYDIPSNTLTVLPNRPALYNPIITTANDRYLVVVGADSVYGRIYDTQTGIWSTLVKPNTLSQQWAPHNSVDSLLGCACLIPSDKLDPFRLYLH